MKNTGTQIIQAQGWKKQTPEENTQYDSVYTKFKTDKTKHSCLGMSIGPKTKETKGIIILKIRTLITSAV